MVLLFLIDGTAKTDEDAMASIILKILSEKRDWQSSRVITNSARAYTAMAFTALWVECSSFEYTTVLNTHCLSDMRCLLSNILPVLNPGDEIELHYVSNSFYYHNIAGVKLTENDLFGRLSSIGDKITFDYVEIGSGN